jgi:hypothetical protein
MPQKTHPRVLSISFYHKYGFYSTKGKHLSLRIKSALVVISAIIMSPGWWCNELNLTQQSMSTICLKNHFIFILHIQI